MSDLEDVKPPMIGALPHDAYMRVLYSMAKSLKRIADATEKNGGKSHFESIFGK